MKQRFSIRAGAFALLCVFEKETGTSGEMLGRRVLSLTIGSAISAGLHGNGVEKTNQYYYHSFLKEQPDLNWRNPAVKQAMYDVLRFWLDRGVDGFRVDVLWLLVKDDQFRDNPGNPGYVPGESSHHRLLPLYTADRPEIHAIVPRCEE